MTSLVLQGDLPMRIIGLPAAPSLSYRIRTGYKERPRRRRLLQLEMISGGANGQTFPVARKFSTVKTRSARRGLTLGVFVLIRLRDEEHRQNNGIQKKDRITGLTGFGPVVVLPCRGFPSLSFAALQRLWSDNPLILSKEIAAMGRAIRQNDLSRLWVRAGVPATPAGCVSFFLFCPRVRFAHAPAEFPSPAGAEYVTVFMKFT